MKNIILVLAIGLSSLSLIAQETSKSTKVKANYRTYYSDIIIDATPEQVWSVLTDFESYAEWSYLFKKLEGDFKDQGTCTVYFDRKPEKNNKQIVAKHVLTVKNGEYFSWNDKFGFGIKDHHVFKVEATKDGKTRFIQTDESKGGLTWLLGKTVDKFHEKHYPEYNQALKKEVERRYKK